MPDKCGPKQSSGTGRACRLARLLDRHGANDGGDHVSLIASGDQAWRTLHGLVAAAETTLDLQYYIWDGDRSGLRLLSALLDAADRGVRVRLLLDDLGAPRSDALLAGVSDHPNVAVQLFNPLPRGLRWLSSFGGRIWRLDRRMHNKAAVVDGVAAVVGSRNIGDRYFGVHAEWNFRDLDLFIAGPAVTDIGDAFERYWSSRWSRAARDLSRRRGSASAARRKVDRAWTGVCRRDAARRDFRAMIREQCGHLIAVDDAAVIYDPPRKVRTGEPRLMQDVLANLDAGPIRELWVVTPFLIPGDDGIDYLAGLVRSGVAVHALTDSAAAAEVSVPFAGYRACRKRMLQAGVALSEFRSRPAGSTDAPGRNLHSKAAVMDRRHVLIGAMNADPRSLFLNTELGLLIRSEPLAEAVVRYIEQASSPENAYRVHLEKGEVRWHDGHRDRYLTREPDMAWWWPTIAWLLSLLPIRKLL